MHGPGQHQAPWAAPDSGTEPALYGAQGQSSVYMAMGREPQVSWPRERQGVGEWGKPASLSRWGLSGAGRRAGALRALAGHTVPSALESRLGCWASKTPTTEAGPELQGEAAVLKSPQPAGSALGQWWPGVGSTPREGGDPNLSHRGPQWPTQVLEGIWIEVTDSAAALFGSHLLPTDSKMLSYPTWPQLGPLWVSGHQHQLTYAKDRELEGAG